MGRVAETARKIASPWLAIVSTQCQQNRSGSPSLAVADWQPREAYCAVPTVGLVRIIGSTYDPDEVQPHGQPISKSLGRTRALRASRGRCGEKVRRKRLTFSVPVSQPIASGELRSRATPSCDPATSVVRRMPAGAL